MADEVHPEVETTEGSSTEQPTLDQLQEQLAESRLRIKMLNRESAERRKKLEVELAKSEAELKKAEKLRGTEKPGEAKSEVETTEGIAAEQPTLEHLQAQLADIQKRIQELNRESAERRKKLEAALAKSEADLKNAEKLQGAAMADEVHPEAETTEGSSTEQPTLDQLQSQLAESQKRIKELNRESAERRKKLEAYEQADADRKSAELSEVEKAKAEADAAKAELEKLKAEKIALELHAGFERTARALKFEFASENAQDTAYRLLNMETVGDGTGMNDALIALQKEHGYLFSKFDPGRTDAGNKGKASGEVETSRLVDAKRSSYGLL